MARQPIETAPKTATEVILFVPKEGHPGEFKIIGHWADDGGDEQPRFRGWFRATAHGFIEISPDPTHWMPMPSEFDCLANLAPGEPYFVMRGQDVLVPHYIERWAVEAKAFGTSIAKIISAQKVAEAMRCWEPRKLPD